MTPAICFSGGSSETRLVRLKVSLISCADPATGGGESPVDRVDVVGNRAWLIGGGQKRGTAWTGAVGVHDLLCR
jgi:hypothetical protein